MWDRDLGFRIFFVFFLFFGYILYRPGGYRGL